MLEERWTATRASNGEYLFVVKQASPPIGQLFLAIVTIIIGVGLLMLAGILIARARRYRFSVSAAGFRVGDRAIPMNRVNSYGITNYHDNEIHNSSSIGGMTQLSMASKRYRVTVQAGGGKWHLAQGLTADQAEGLLADIERALHGTL